MGTGDNLEVVRCDECGHILGKIDDESRAEMECSKCKSRFIITRHDGAITHTNTYRKQHKQQK